MSYKIGILNNSVGVLGPRMCAIEGRMTEQSIDSTADCKLFEFLICGVVIGSICVLGLLGNVTSMMVLWKHKMETATILLLQSLAFTDCLLLTTTLFVYTLPAVHLYTGELKNLYDGCDYVKTFLWPLAMIAHTAAVWLTVLVTLHRFFCVCKPLGMYIKFSTQFIRILVLIVFSTSVLYNLPRFFEHQVVSSTANSYQNGSNATNASERILGDSTFYQILYSNILYFPVMYIIPLISLMYLNTKLIKAVNQLKTRKAQLTGHQAPEDHITLCIIFIVFIFVICQTPALINQILWAVTDHADRDCGKFHFYYTKISDVLVVINSSVNFIIYCLFGKSFRQIFVDFFCANSCITYIKTRNTCSHTLVAQDTVIPMQDLSPAPNSRPMLPE